MRDNQANDHFGQDSRPVAEKIVTISPGHGRSVGLGVYRTGQIAPDYDIILHPDIGDSMGISHEQLDMPGKSQYMLLYQFHNFGDTSCEVTVRQKKVTTVAQD